MMSKWAEEASLTVALFSADAQNALVPPVRGRWRQVRLFQIRNLQTHLFCFLFWFWFCFSCFSHCILFCRCKQLADSCAKMLKDVELHLWMNSKNLAIPNSTRAAMPCITVTCLILSFNTVLLCPWPMFFVSVLLMLPNKYAPASLTKFSWPCKWHPIFKRSRLAPPPFFRFFLQIFWPWLPKKRKFENEPD